MNADKEIEIISGLVLQLSEQLEKIDGVRTDNLWPLHPDKVALEPFMEAKDTINKIFTRTRQLNESMLSDLTILNLLLYETAAIRLNRDISDSDLLEIAKDNITKLIQYRANRDVMIPIISLDVSNMPFKFGPITFCPISPADKLSHWWNIAKSKMHEDIDYLVISYARVNVEGDQYRSVDTAALLVREALLLLRGIGFPIIAEEIHQIGIINEYPLWGFVPYQLGKPTESLRIDSQARLLTRIGPAQRQYRLHEDMLSKISRERINSFLDIFNNKNFSAKNKIHQKILSGFRWLGEATKPDALEARFAKLAFSLEAFIGGEAKDDTLPPSGITAMLAERAAFLIGNDLQTRRTIDKKIRAYYGKRSAISHGRSPEIKTLDFEDFGGLVREIGWGLLEKENNFSNVNELQSWIIDQKYST